MAPFSKASSTEDVEAKYNVVMNCEHPFLSSHDPMG